MSVPDITIRPAEIADLDNINKLIEAAIMNWDLPERVKRLSLPSYYYNEIDLQHFDIDVAVHDNKIIAVIAYVQAESGDLPKGKTGLFLHGIYVHPGLQKTGIGSLLITGLEKIASHKKLDGLLVKAQKDAIPFFIKQGMNVLEVTDTNKDYENRYWKEI